MAYVPEAERVRQRLRETLTPGERLANWWYYHKLHVAVLAAALLLIVYFAAQALSNPVPDCTLAWVGRARLTKEQEADIIAYFAPYAEDVGGDGRVCVTLQQYPLDMERMEARGMTSGQQEYASLLALEADLATGQSGLFLTDQPGALERYAGAMLYLDGSEPAEGADDWENMFVPLGGGVSLGCRGCWDEEQQSLAAARALWTHFRGSGATG